MERFIPKNSLVPVDHDPFAGPAIERCFRTTEQQREVWLSSKMGRDASCSYNESVSLRLHGQLDPISLSGAVDLIIGRHGSLRSVFSASGEQLIELAEPLSRLELIDLGSLGKEKCEERLKSLDREWMSSPFDLENGPLFKPLLIRLTEEEHILRFVAHHSVCDGWSLGILMVEVSEAYSALVRGQDPDLPEAVDFHTYMHAMEEYHASEEYQRVKQYWLDLYADRVPRMDLRVDVPRPSEKTYHASRLDIPLPTDLVTGLKRLGSRFGSTLVATMLSAFEILVARRSGQLDLVIGLPAAGQSDMDMKHLVGHCVSLLPLRSNLDPNDRFSDHLGKRRKEVLDAYDNQRFTLGDLLQELDVPREPGRVPLAPVVFNFDMNMDEGVFFEGLRHEYSSDPRQYEHFELALNCAGDGDRLTLEWGYNTDLFHESTIQSWMNEFTSIVERIIRDPGIRVSELLRHEERDDAPPMEWYGTRIPLPDDRTACTMFAEQVLKFPGKAAIKQGDRIMTYSELDAASLSVALRLVRSGIVRGDLVGVISTPCPEMVAAMLGVLRAGAAFVPIDPHMPAERINGIIGDAHLKRVLLMDGLSVDLEDKDIALPLIDTTADKEIERAPETDLSTEDPAYVIYTSGSTGKPKGVVIPHRGLVRLIGPRSFIPFSEDLIWIHHLSISFDASIVGIWGALLAGGTVAMAEQPKPSLNELADAMVKHHVNAIGTSSGLFDVLVEERMDALKEMRYLATGGDVISLKHARKVFEELGPGILVNAYGPTENSVASSSFILNKESDLERPLPIGKPFENSLCYVLNEMLQPVAIGERGELFTAGPGTALGYLGRPELNAERFIKDPFDPSGGMMYRTGDMVRWLPDGDLEFLGRVDDQVKVRGFRIELGEIDAALNDLPVIGSKAVIVHGTVPSDKKIVAYVTPSERQEVNDALQQRLEQAVADHLSSKLPEYMVPAAVVVLDRMPLNSSGKVDKAALPEPVRFRAQERTVQVPPRNDMEHRLVGIWEKLLGVKDVGVKDNFFQLGGHSLLGLQMLAQVEKQVDIGLPLRSLFQAPTIRQLAELLDKGGTAHDWKNLMAIQPKGDRTPFFLVHGDEANHFLPGFLGKDQPFYGFAHQGEDGQAIRYTEIPALATHLISEMRSVRPHGPYMLGGYSFGGIVAYEMAQQLLAAGEEVPLLALLDSYCPKVYREVMRMERKVHEPLKDLIIGTLIDLFTSETKPLPTWLRHYNIMRTYNRAMERYDAAPYPGSLVLFRCRKSLGSLKMGWTGMVAGDIDVCLLEGDHSDLMNEEQLRSVAAYLSKALAERSKPSFLRAS